MAGGGAVLAGAGAIASVIGGDKASRAEERSAKRNARLLDAQAIEEKRAAEREAKIFKREADIELGDTVSSLAKSGVDVSSGSPMALLISDRLTAQADAAEIKRSGSNRASSLRSQAGNERSRARGLRRARPLQTAGTILTGFSRF